MHIQLLEFLHLMHLLFLHSLCILNANDVMPFCDPLASDAAVVSSTILYVYKFVMNAVSYCCYL
jgi:hypothetical protein